MTSRGDSQNFGGDGGVDLEEGLVCRGKTGNEGALTRKRNLNRV